jgi:hypothetical protein
MDATGVPENAKAQSGLRQSRAIKSGAAYARIYWFGGTFYRQKQLKKA